MYKMCLEIIYQIYMYKYDLALKTFNGRYAIEPNQTKPFIYLHTVKRFKVLLSNCSN